MDFGTTSFINSQQSLFSDTVKGYEKRTSFIYLLVNSSKMKCSFLIIKVPFQNHLYFTIDKTIVLIAITLSNKYMHYFIKYSFVLYS